MQTADFPSGNPEIITHTVTTPGGYTISYSGATLVEWINWLQREYDVYEIEKALYEE